MKNLLTATFVVALLTLAVHLPPAHAFDYETDWTVAVTENGVERSLAPTTPDDASFKVTIDQRFAPGWGCEVRPMTWRDNHRWRWLQCNRAGSKVQIRTDCHSDRHDSRMQELWLGDNVSVRLMCNSGVSP